MAGSAVIIPLVAGPQNFSTTLAGVTYTMKIRWNPAAQYWTIDIGDPNGSTRIAGIPLLPGTDLLQQYGYFQFNGTLVVVNYSDAAAPPGFADLGKTSQLVFTPT